MRALMAVYQPLLVDSACTIEPPSIGPRVPGERENQPLVGRVHYSLRSTLSAQFRWGFGASELLTKASQYVRTTKFRDYRDAGLQRSIRNLTYPYRESSVGGSIPSESRSQVE